MTRSSRSPRAGCPRGEIAPHFADIYGVNVVRDSISRVTDAVLEEVRQWQQRPLDEVYPVIFIDAIQLKIRDGHGAAQGLLHRLRRYRRR